jgi:hypothetical protein
MSAAAAITKYRGHRHDARTNMPGVCLSSQ